MFYGRLDGCQEILSVLNLQIGKFWLEAVGKSRLENVYRRKI